MVLKVWQDNSDIMWLCWQTSFSKAFDVCPLRNNFLGGMGVVLERHRLDLRNSCWSKGIRLLPENLLGLLFLDPPEEIDGLLDGLLGDCPHGTDGSIDPRLEILLKASSVTKRSKLDNARYFKILKVYFKTCCSFLVLHYTVEKCGSLQQHFWFSPIYKKF